MMICPMLHAQQQDKVTYLYDAAGNRISRTIVLAPRSAPVLTEEEQPVVYTETLADIKVKIYPNPTDGLLTVEINNLPEGQTAQIWLYAMSGQLINSYKAVNNVERINISNQPAGVYIMQIVAGKYRTEWKIIKR
jgi:YD repeat-containing protein